MTNVPATTRGQCEGISKATGRRCPNATVSGRRHCFVHIPPGEDPALDIKRDAARRRGGYAATRQTDIPEDAPMPSLASADDIRQFIEATIDATRRKRMSPHQANAIGRLLDCLLRTAEIALSDRIQRLEEAVLEKKLAGWLPGKPGG